METYLGIQKQIERNNRKTILYLIAFPLLVLLPFFLLLFVIPAWSGWQSFDEFTTNEMLYGDNKMAMVKDYFMDYLSVVPFVLVGVGIWFFIAYKWNTAIIRRSTKAESLERKENMRVYNLTENLCMSVGMPMPKLNVIETPALNAFASGIDEKSFTVTLTRGLIDTLEDDELEGVIAHELMHIRNRDVRLLVVSIVFVGIFALASQILFRVLLNVGLGGGRKRSGKGGGKAFLVVLVALIAVAISYFLSVLFKFGISRKREFMADAGAAEMTRKPHALASALRKIVFNSDVEEANDEMKAMFIVNNLKGDKTFSLSRLFKTHPPTEERIKVLEQF